MMNIDLDKVEELFATKFLRDEHFAEMRCFDGILHWWVLWDEQRQNLHIAADIQLPMRMNPILEIGIHECSFMTMGNITSGGTVLSFYREEYTVGEPDSIHTMITRTTEGHLSFAANIGRCSS